MEIQIGDTFKNWKEEVHEIISISKTGRILNAINVANKERCRFYFYNASGKYIKLGTPNTDLGYNINN